MQTRPPALAIALLTEFVARWHPLVSTSPWFLILVEWLRGLGLLGKGKGALTG